MTATRTRRRPPIVDDPTRECVVYDVLMLDPRTSYQSVVLGWVGESWDPDRRLGEHLEKAYGDTIVEMRIVGRHKSKTAALKAEKARIRARRPLYNWEWNQDNPQMIPPSEQEALRYARDDRLGRPRWQPPRAERVPFVPRPRWGLARALTASAVGYVAVWLVGWVVLFLAAGWWVDRWWGPFWQWAGWSGEAASWSWAPAVVVATWLLWWLASRRLRS